MNHVERQNQGGHVKEWLVSLRDGAVCTVVARTREEAIRESVYLGHAPSYATCVVNQERPADALFVARFALEKARTESAKGRR
jgi:hypothetical protein